VKDMATTPKDLKDYMMASSAARVLIRAGIRVNVRELTKVIAIIVGILVGPDILKLGLPTN
tara:strand:+ start:356 stop:538 length:183 start_codon:yes stop_codon:yes gene_type:complete